MIRTVLLISKTKGISDIGTVMFINVGKTVE